MKKQIDHLIIKNAKTIGDYLFLRQLRNEVRLNMTGSTNLISLIDQIQFYFLKPANTPIYIAFLKNKRVGYLLIRHTNNAYWLTEAILSKHRHLGIATALINFAKERYSPLKAEIQKSNQASINLHIKSGFILLDSYENLAIYALQDLSGANKHP